MNKAYAILGLVLAYSMVSMGCAKGMKALETAANNACNDKYTYDLDRTACYAGVSNFLDLNKAKDFANSVTQQSFNGKSYYVISFEDFYNYTTDRTTKCHDSFKDNVPALAACNKGVEVTADLLIAKDDNHQDITLYRNDGVRLVALNKTYIKKLLDGTNGSTPANTNPVQEQEIQRELERQPSK